MAPEQDTNQDALAAEWSGALEKEGPAAAGTDKPAAVAAADEAAAKWAAMAA